MASKKSSEEFNDTPKRRICAYQAMYCRHLDDHDFKRLSVGGRLLWFYLWNRYEAGALGVFPWNDGAVASQMFPPANGVAGFPTMENIEIFNKGVAELLKKGWLVIENDYAMLSNVAKNNPTLNAHNGSQRAGVYVQLEPLKDLKITAQVLRDLELPLPKDDKEWRKARSRKFQETGRKVGVKDPSSPPGSSMTHTPKSDGSSTGHTTPVAVTEAESEAVSEAASEAQPVAEAEAEAVSNPRWAGFSEKDTPSQVNEISHALTSKVEGFHAQLDEVEEIRRNYNSPPPKRSRLRNKKLQRALAECAMEDLDLPAGCES